MKTSSARPYPVNRLEKTQTDNQIGTSTDSPSVLDWKHIKPDSRIIPRYVLVRVPNMARTRIRPVKALFVMGF